MFAYFLRNIVRNRIAIDNGYLVTSQKIAKRRFSTGDAACQSHEQHSATIHIENARNIM